MGNQSPHSEFCGHCGREKKPLFQTYFCPNDCDRKSATAVRVEDSLRCPKCQSLDTEPFLDCIGGNFHCVTCGATWWVDVGD